MWPLPERQVPMDDNARRKLANASKTRHHPSPLQVFPYSLEHSPTTLMPLA